jgi:hypothetical protein
VRHLVSTERCFTECTSRKYTADECLVYLEEVLGPDYSNHVIQDLEVRVHQPRDADVLNDSYYQVGIPVNMYGEMKCDLNDGRVVYPFVWKTAAGNFALPTTDCKGLMAGSCCDLLKNEMATAGIPLVDIYDNRVSCWVHQEPLEPIISETTGQPAYISYRMNDSDDCEEFEVSVGQVQSNDAITISQLESNIITMDGIVGAGGTDQTCNSLLDLQDEMLGNARGQPLAMQFISSFLNGMCDEASSTVDPVALVTELEQIIEFLEKQPIKSDVNTIVIYTDANGNVLEPPKLGGSRTIMDRNTNDPGCLDDVEECDETVMCPTGQYKTFECVCTSDLVQVCPSGSIPQLDPPMCIACECAFCQPDGSSCCEASSNGDVCSAVSNQPEQCRFDEDFYFPGYYNNQVGGACDALLVVGPSAISVGCGCVPSATKRCTFDPESRGDGSEMCFACNAADLGSDNADCATCKSCFQTVCFAEWDDYRNADPQVHMALCKSTILDDGVTSSEIEWQICLEESFLAAGAEGIGPDCSASCIQSCKKSYASIS